MLFDLKEFIDLAKRETAPINIKQSYIIAKRLLNQSSYVATNFSMHTPSDIQFASIVASSFSV